MDNFKRIPTEDERKTERFALALKALFIADGHSNNADRAAAMIVDALKQIVFFSPDNKASYIYGDKVFVVEKNDKHEYTYTMLDKQCHCHEG